MPKTSIWEKQFPELSNNITKTCKKLPVTKPGTGQESNEPICQQITDGKTAENNAISNNGLENLTSKYVRVQNLWKTQDYYQDNTNLQTEPLPPMWDFSHVRLLSQKPLSGKFKRTSWQNKKTWIPGTQRFQTTWMEITRKLEVQIMSFNKVTNEV